jgi:ADP-ribosyl-[dinitrogen reductase] hydrolase
MDGIRDRQIGTLLGLAVGDALGTTLEFHARRPLTSLHTEMSGGGVFSLPPGHWTDDTAMAVAMARSLIARRSFDPFDIMNEWVAWYGQGKHSCTGTCFDIGNATAAALRAFERNPASLPSISPDALGNGTLMRAAPAVLFAATEHEAGSLSYAHSKLTHGEEAARATEWFGRLLFTTAREGRLGRVHDKIAERKREEVRSSGFYRDTLEAALWAVATTHSFEDAVIQAVNLGDDADTVGAVIGQLAGALYGYSAIPPRWLEPLAWRDELVGIAEGSMAVASAH